MHFTKEIDRNRLYMIVMSLSFEYSPVLFGLKHLPVPIVSVVIHSSFGSWHLPTILLNTLCVCWQGMFKLLSSFCKKKPNKVILILLKKVKNVHHFSSSVSLLYRISWSRELMLPINKCTEHKRYQSSVKNILFYKNT